MNHQKKLNRGIKLGLVVLGRPIWLLSPDKDAKDSWDTGPVLKDTLQFREAMCSQNWVGHCFPHVVPSHHVSPPAQQYTSLLASSSTSSKPNFTWVVMFS